MRWTQRERTIGKQLLLAETLEGTMARLGKRTRAHMRYYRRRLVEEVPCEFVADVRGMLSDAELLATSASALQPIAAKEWRLRYRSSCELSGGFVAGLRATDGRWLSLVGGWRQGKTTVVQWQMNVAGMEKISVRTAMRMFLLEHEVERGAERLMFYGGTSHSMQHSFEQEQVRDVIVRRQTVRGRLLRMVARLVSSPRSVTGRMNFLAAALRCEELEWRDVSVDERQALTGAMLLGPTVPVGRQD